MAISLELPVLEHDRGDAQRCPSAQPNMEDARVLGVVQRTTNDRRVVYVDEAVPVTPEVLRMSGGAEPTEVMRFSAKCDEKMCMHFDGSRCQLASRVVQMLPAVVDVLPACSIRPTCRWYLQEGPPACQRCPEIVTINDDSGDTLLAEMAYGASGTDNSRE